MKKYATLGILIASSLTNPSCGLKENMNQRPLSSENISEDMTEEQEFESMGFVNTVDQRLADGQNWRSYAQSRIVSRNGSSIEGRLSLFKMRYQPGVLITGSIVGLENDGDEYIATLHSVGSCATNDAMSAGNAVEVKRKLKNGDPEMEPRPVGFLGTIQRKRRNSSMIVGIRLFGFNLEEMRNLAIIIQKVKKDSLTNTAEAQGPRLACGTITRLYLESTPTRTVPVKSARIVSPSNAALQVKGKIHAVDSPQGLHIWGEVSGLPPNSTHGIHIHENPSRAACTGDFSGVRGHLDPTNTQKHGDPNGQTLVHLGDLGNITSDANGVAKVSLIREGLTMGFENNGIHARAIVIDEKKDDFSSDQSEQTSGQRIGCGVFGAE